MPRRVAILVETSLASGRAILSGIARYIHERNDWNVFFHTGPLGALRPSALRQWQGDGILARISDARILELVAAHRVPVVDVLGNIPGSTLPLVCGDEDAIARTVVEHFKQRGHRQFAFLGLRGEHWSEGRRDAFSRHVRATPQTTVAVREISHAEREPDRWDRYFADLCQWLESLPKPLALMLASDQLGPDVLEACAHLGHTVPEQVSVVGVDNDEPYCELCQPRLSSVEANHERIGYDAAHLLDALMRGEPAPAKPIKIPPRFLQVRQSSDATAVEDPVVVRAMKLIREHATEGIAIDTLAQRVGVSRSVLQRRFRATLGQTINHALVTARLSRAKEMLAKTNLPIAEIAERVGFNHQEYLGHVFRHHTGQTPAQFRKQAAG